MAARDPGVPRERKRQKSKDPTPAPVAKPKRVTDQSKRDDPTDALEALQERDRRTRGAFGRR